MTLTSIIPAWSSSLWIIALGSLATAGWLAKCIYRLYIHPLSAVPGPRLAACSSLWLAWHTFIGDECSAVFQLHKQYGPVLRVGPNDVDIADGDAVDSIYLDRGGFQKTQAYSKFDIDGHSTIFSTQTLAERANRAKAVVSLFSTASIRNSQPVLGRVVDEFVTRLQDEARTGKPVNVLNVSRAMAIDAVTAYLFQDQYGGISEGTSQMSASPFVDAYVGVGAFFNFLPGHLGDLLMPLIDLTMGNAETAHSMTLVDRYTSHLSKTASAGSGSYASRLLERSVSQDQVQVELKDVCFAGTDSTSINMATILWNLSKNPDAYSRLRKEVLDRTANNEDAMSGPYLRGVVREGLRLSMANPIRLPRLVPQSGWRYHDYFFPAGTSVGVASFQLHQDEEVFPDAQRFLPERWLDPTDRMLTNFFAFGKGNRACIAQNLGTAELTLATVKVVQADLLRGATVVQDRIEILEWFNSRVKGEQILVQFDSKHQQSIEEAVRSIKFLGSANNLQIAWPSRKRVPRRAQTALDQKVSAVSFDDRLLSSDKIIVVTLGFDGSMMNGLNILPSYTDYFHLTTATLALNTASVWMGSTLSGIVFAKVPDLIGRKWTLFVSAIITIVGVILQTAAQDTVMFIVARIVIGFGTGGSTVAGPVYLAETLPVHYRSWGLGLFYDFWYVGGLIAAGVTYGTAKMDSTWAWRLPSALQGFFSLLCIVLLPFTPESPRWLQSQGRDADALRALAQTYSNGNIDDKTVQAQFRQMADTLNFETTFEKPSFTKQFVSKASTRKRVYLACSVAVCCMLSGNNIVSYYFGAMLTQAGVTNSTTQLEVNIILNAWCLVIAVVGTSMANRLGRKNLAAFSTGFLTLFIFLVGALTKLYGDSDNASGIYGTVAIIFLFQGAYSFGWTPLTVLYPPEVLNYSIRGAGMGLYTFLTNGLGLMVTFAFPFALEKIGWKTYMINGAWDVLELLFVVVYWVETNGRTLEDIDDSLDPVKMQTILGVGLKEQETFVQDLDFKEKREV
ncbi:hypothetical protein AK830_g5556 [Neonectria ditissima]|uniref:Major facilitator superfamily (MFS) profile domain-containing protein n=1 Tax=Neonectria ditissima TaxID=78410 RepID=A0A0P7AT16_9HYPO|nr:hypothetical protein AK830_g5556 [Neonectria ditissima]